LGWLEQGWLEQGWLEQGSLYRFCFLVCLVESKAHDLPLRKLASRCCPGESGGGGNYSIMQFRERLEFARCCQPLTSRAEFVIPGAP